MIHISHEQLFTILDELRVLHVYKPEGGKLTLSVADESGPQTVSVTDFKARYVGELQDLEERRREIEENRFASPIAGELLMGEHTGVPVLYVKRNEDLTPQETDRKRELLREIDAALGHARLVIGAMNHLQVHHKELASRLANRVVPLQKSFGAVHGERLRWTKGIKSAALYCLRESKSAANSSKTLLELCSEFLDQYSIVGDEDYTVEQLFRNVQQVMMLERGE